MVIMGSPHRNRQDMSMVCERRGSRGNIAKQCPMGVISPCLFRAP